MRFAQVILKEIIKLEPLKLFATDIKRGIMSPEFKLLTFMIMASDYQDTIEDLLYTTDVSLQMISGIRQIIYLEPWTRTIPLQDLFDRSQYYVLDILEVALGNSLYLKTNEMFITNSELSITLSICLEPQYDVNETICEIWPDLKKVSSLSSKNEIDWPDSLYPYWMFVVGNISPIVSVSTDTGLRDSFVL